ncbi:hypothetical protein [Chryseobacterium sp. FH1]|nr:hypothetical protein [Chryseobacterium sp. FH1]
MVGRKIFRPFSSENSTVAKDSAKSATTIKEDPPIKYGGHLKQ